MTPENVDRHLASSDQIVKTLVESASNFAIYHLSYDESCFLNFKVKYVSPSIKNILGIENTMSFAAWFENILSDDRKEVEEGNAKAFETGTFDETFRIWHPQKGERRWVRAVSSFSDTSSFERGNNSQVIGLMIDVTKSKKLEAALEEREHHRQRPEFEVAERARKLIESKARYRGIVKGSPDMVCRFMPDGTITFVNQATADYLGIPVENLMGRSFYEWNSTNEEADSLEKKIKFALLNSNSPSFDTRYDLSDGSVRWVHWIVLRLGTREDSFFEYQAVGQDITRQRALRIEREKADQLRKRTQKLEALGTLSAGIAHDFNNILAVLLGNVQLVMDDVPEGSRVRNNIDEMTKAILLARDMIKQILTFCRQGEQSRSPLSLTPVVKESVKFLRSSIPATIEIIDHIEETDLVMADPTQISQVMMNLGSNAAYAMDNRTGILELTLKNVTIDEHHKDRFRVPFEGRYVKMKFRDTGSGMPSYVLSRLFDPYFTTKPEGKGSGMGLAVVHGIVESHGGVIWVESEPGKGAVFKMLFPVAEGEVITETERAASLMGGDERILLVDDRENLLTVEKELLERLGYQVTAVMDPVEALEIFREHPYEFDLVYTDMTMPHMTGLTLSKEILEIRPELPIIIYTGLGDLVDAEEIKRSGISAFLKKPILLEDLASTIREVLEHGKAVL
ncbi:PAS domain S-box protein [delta proteobacterium NaphS2]|nr:PAS domain S-box protein [delta proteobacterium NaphS2]